MTNSYYKKLMIDYLKTSEFKEHQKKHHMSYEATAKAVTSYRTKSVGD